MLQVNQEDVLDIFNLEKHGASYGYRMIGNKAEFHFIDVKF